MAFSEIYVDPSINADTGAGTSGDPYGDLEWAIEQETFDLTNGTRVNIKSTGTETLAASLDIAMADTGVSVAWVPGTTAQCVFQGYTSAAGDGGIGTISGGGSVSICDGNQSDVSFADLHCTNSGTAQMFDVGSYCNFYRCEIDTVSFNGSVVDTQQNCSVVGCHIHTVTGNIGYGVKGTTGLIAIQNYVDITSGAEFGMGGIQTAGTSPTTILRNIVLTASEINTIAILCSAGGSAVIMNNSCYNVGGGGNTIAGIRVNGNLRQNAIVANNLVEGFDGTGSVGVEVIATGNTGLVLANACFDCDTDFDIGTTGEVLKIGWTDGTDTNESLSASPFTNAAAGDFTPVDTGAVKEGSLPDDVGGT